MEWEKILKESMKEASVPEDVRRKIHEMYEHIVEYRLFVTQQSKASHFNESDQSFFDDMSSMFHKLLDLYYEMSWENKNPSDF